MRTAQVNWSKMSRWRKLYEHAQHTTMQTKTSTHIIDHITRQRGPARGPPPPSRMSRTHSA